MNSSLERPDRRKQRTRAQLREALMALIVEKGFDAISVQDIAERANVSRATFYLHYADKEELLNKSMMDVYNELVAHVEMFGGDNYLEALRNGDHSCFYDKTDFQHVADYADFYRVLLSEKGVASFLVKTRTYLAELNERYLIQPLAAHAIRHRLPPSMMSHAIAGAQIAVLSWWLKDGMRHTPDEMAKMFYEFIAFGFWWNVGIEVPVPTD